jgi:hypothetical protein
MYEQLQQFTDRQLAWYLAVCHAELRNGLEEDEREEAFRDQLFDGTSYTSMTREDLEHSVLSLNEDAEMAALRVQHTLEDRPAPR